LNPRDLLKTASKLVPQRGKPKQSDLLRATSTTYYALFHTLAKSNADCLIGGTVSQRNNQAWTQTYRSLDHGVAKNACLNQSMIALFPDEIRNFADLFVAMQAKRHTADYDPTARHSKSSVLIDIKIAEDAITRFNRVSIKHKRAFAAYILFKNRF
jgi:uncharacterized protein (UPF0332 family)